MFLEAFDQIKDKLLIPKLQEIDKGIKRIKVKSKYGAESLVDKGVAGATAYLATKSPLLAAVSPIILDVLKQRADDQQSIDKKLKDPNNQAINEKYGKGANKATANAVRQLDRMKRKDPKSYKESEQYKEFGAVYESLRTSKKKENLSDDSEISGSGDSNSELLQQIVDNTNKIAESIAENKEVVRTPVTGVKPPVVANTGGIPIQIMERVATQMNAKAGVSPTASGSVNNIRTNLPPLLSGMFMRAGIPTGGSNNQITDDVAANKMEAEEAAKEQQMIVVQESNQTQSLLSDIRESLIEKNEKESTSSETKSAFERFTDMLPGRRNRVPNGPRPAGGKLAALKDLAKSGVRGVGGAIARQVPIIGAVSAAADIIPDFFGGSGAKQTTVPETNTTNKPGGLGSGLKGFGKAALKKIPLIGALAGLGFAGSRLMSGDVKGAGLEALGGVLGSIPIAGTALSLGTDALLANYDAEKEQPKVEPAESTLKESKIFNQEFKIAGAPVEPAKDLTKEQFAEIEKAVAANPNAMSGAPSFVMEKFNKMKSAAVQGSKSTTQVGPQDTTSMAKTNNSIYSLTENAARTTSVREKMMMEKSTAPVVINNSTSMGNSSGGSSGMYKPFVRNPESTLSKLHERDYWGRAK